MNKSKIVFMILNIVISVVLSLCFVYTKAQIDINTRPPYGLSTNSIKFSIFIDGNTIIDENTESEVISKLHSILKDNGIVLISDNIDNPGLGVYDPKKYFSSYNLMEGHYFDKDNNNSALIKTDSYIYSNLDVNDTFESVNNQTFSVAGIYNDSYPLYDVKKEYVYNFFYNPSLFSYYYIDNGDRMLLDNTLNKEIIPLFEKNHYIIQIESRYDNSFKSISRALLANSIYFLSIVVMLFMYINLFFCYIGTTQRWIKVMNIHSMLGATRIKLTHYISNNFIMSITLGSIIGGFLYYFIFYNSLLVIPRSLLLISIVINVIISYILLVMSVFIFCYTINHFCIFRNNRFKRSEGYYCLSECI